MSRTWKDRGPKKYRKGYCWKSDSYSGKILRRRIERYDPPSGGSFKKLGNMLDEYAGM